MSVMSKIGETLICLKAGRVTLPYPANPAPKAGKEEVGAAPFPEGEGATTTRAGSKRAGTIKKPGAAPFPKGGCEPTSEPPERFRGRPIFNPAKCIGCAGCANNCPAREILVYDVCQEIRILKYLGRRCTYCGRCADLCPEKAITMSREFENATNDAADLQQRLELFMSTCQRCGRCFKGPTIFEELKMKGFRLDDLQHDRWVFKSKAYLDTDPPADDIKIELD